MSEIRTLRADEIDCRVQSIKEKGCILLLYKDARCDMKILDETFGIYGWQRTHEIINNSLFCTVEIYDKQNKIWIKKQDVGVESFTEKTKGEASDSFKRACFNIGIGRELYTSPFTWVTLNAGESISDNGKFKLKYGLSFSVKEIQTNSEKEITHLAIVDNTGKERFRFDSKLKKEEPIEKEEPKTMLTDLTIAKQEIKECTTIEELNLAIKTWECFWTDEMFKRQAKAKRTELTNK